jgi:hypothetical protein
MSRWTHSRWTFCRLSLTGDGRNTRSIISLPPPSPTAAGIDTPLLSQLSALPRLFMCARASGFTAVRARAAPPARHQPAFSKTRSPTLDLCTSIPPPQRSLLPHSRLCSQPAESRPRLHDRCFSFRQTSPEIMTGGVGWTQSSGGLHVRDAHAKRLSVLRLLDLSQPSVKATGRRQG